MRRIWLLTAAIALVLGLSVDDRQVARIADGRQMIFTAVALTEAGTLGQARGRDLAVPRPQGDAVSRFGLGMTFAHVPAAALAPLVEERLGPGTSQPLFLVAPIAFVLASGWFAARAARRLGGGPVAQSTALLLATIASPFASYAAMEQSEALQGLALVAAFRFALRGTPVSAAIAGACGGVAMLAKSSLIVAVPLVLLPLFFLPERRRLAAAAALGFLPLLALWAYLDAVRFGRLFGGYEGEAFTHAFLDGVRRLTVGLNKGLLLYFPAAVASFVAAARALRLRQAAMAWLAPVLVLVALLALAAPWWAWDGVGGWGPRLLVPAIPLLAASAGVELARWLPAARIAVVALSVAVNLPPVLQHPTPVVQYIWTSAWPIEDAASAAQVPPFARRPQPDGRVAVPPEHVLANVASASPFVLLPWFFDVSRDVAERAAERLNAPPWLSARPDIKPSPPISGDEVAAIAPRPRLNYWGRGFTDAPDDSSRVYAYDTALENQVFRAQRLRDVGLAVSLAQKLESLAPRGLADALLLESYRLAKRKQDAIDFLTSLSHDRRGHPAINVVLALWDRDEGNEERARVLLQTSADSYPNAPVQRALTAPLSAWPPDFAGMTEDLTLEIRSGAR